MIRTRFLSVDPYMRGRMNAGASYAPGVELDEVMVGGAVGDVVASRHPDFAEGDVAQASIGWQSHGVARGEEAHKVDPRLGPISTALGVLGMPGMTAYFGLLGVGQPRAGETVVVSGAAGAVGRWSSRSRRSSCRAVAAGSDAKVDYICNELGFAGGFNYKTALITKRWPRVPTASTSTLIPSVVRSQTPFFCSSLRVRAFRFAARSRSTISKDRSGVCAKRGSL